MFWIKKAENLKFQLCYVSKSSVLSPALSVFLIEIERFYCITYILAYILVIPSFSFNVYNSYSAEIHRCYRKSFSVSQSVCIIKILIMILLAII